MTLRQLHVVEKIKFLVSGNTWTKKQIVEEVENKAQIHRNINQRQEAEDEARVDHAVKDLANDTKMSDYSYSKLSSALAVSIFINLLFLVGFLVMWYFYIYK